MKKYLVIALALTAFAPKWNLMLKGMTDWAYGYLASLEYYPDVTQNFRPIAHFAG